MLRLIEFICYIYTVAVTVDWVQDILYWTDMTLGRIESINLVTNVRRLIVELKSEAPLTIAVFPKPFNR